MMAVVTRLEIETGKLQRDITDLGTYLTNMRRIGENMMAGINALNSMWEGEAKNAFVAQFQTDYETLNSMAEVIEDLIKDLEQARTQYDTCENRVGSIVSAMRV